MLLIGRCFYLQCIKRDYFCSVSEKQRQKLISEKPQRGVILDRCGRVLAASNKIQTIFAEPRALKSAEKTAASLAPVVKVEAIQIYNLIKNSGNPGYVKIKSDADEEQCKAASKISGVGVESEWRRYYPMGSLASHIVGFTGTDNFGLEGLELKYDKKLRGYAGGNVVFADVLRRPVRLKEQNSFVTDGCGIILTFDSTIQQFVREELVRVKEEYEADSAVAVVAEPNSGAILAMVSLPDFEPSRVRYEDVDSFRNRVITDQFEPGSILKPIVAAIAIDGDIIDKDEKIFCENGDYRGKGFGRIGEYGEHSFGELSVSEIIIHSSNIGMAKIGQKAGAKRLCEGLRLFGFGEKTGIDLPGEAAGLLRSSDEWNGYSVTRIPFGQEISTTTLQLVQAFCIISNGGHYVRPYLVRAIVDNEGNIVRLKRPPPPVGFVIKPEVARWIVREAMTGVVNEGTGKKAKLEKWQVFGKTGTAQLSLLGQKGYSEKDYIASFVAGAPAENPAVIVLVMVCRPDVSLGKGYTGGTVAAPVAGRIIEKTLNYLESHNGIAQYFRF
jgi:cell division protein FtsI/penicillin-binding protein 2